MKKQKKQLTLVDLSNQITESFEGLARITKSGFDDVETRMSKLETGQSNLEIGQKNLEGRMVTLESGQKVIQRDVDDIKIRLGNHAPQFEVEALKKRVTKLEKKVGIA